MTVNLSQITFEAEKLIQNLGRQPLTGAMDDAGQSPGGQLTVLWTQTAGGVLNPSTGSLVGATGTVLSGTLAALAMEGGVHSVVRQYTEISVGDLIVTLSGSPVVELCPGQVLSGTLPLAVVAAFGPTFFWQGMPYVQKMVGDDLRTLWTEAAGGIVISQGILLKRSA